MTSEQEKAIKRLEKRIKDNEDYKTTQVWLTDDVSAVYTVLNMLKEKEAEIEKLKKDFKIVDEECSRLERKEAKQDKIIEVMTLFMSNLDIDEEICKHQVQAFCDNKPEGVTLDVCAKCIKQYFEKQAKEKGE